MTPAHHIEVKICGLTTPGGAAACVAVGVDAVGLVFHPPSPRHLSTAQAHEIAAAVPAGVMKVGVFVEQDADAIRRVADKVGLDVAQLHRPATAAEIATLQAAGLRVVALLRTTGENLLRDAAQVPDSAGVLVECGHGRLPGGTGATWAWGEAAALAAMRPFAVAGGLSAVNVTAALAA